VTRDELYDSITTYTQTSKARRFCQINRIDTDDAKHEIFVKLASCDLTVVEKPANWVARCGWRALLDLAEKDQRLRFTDELSEIPAPAEGQSLSERAMRVRHAIDALPTTHRDALMARVGISTESCRTVAKRNRVTPQTICNWARKAADSIRSELEGSR